MASPSRLAGELRRKQHTDPGRLLTLQGAELRHQFSHRLFPTHKNLGLAGEYSFKNISEFGKASPDKAEIAKKGEKLDHAGHGADVGSGLRSDDLHSGSRGARIPFQQEPPLLHCATSDGGITGEEGIELFC